MVSVIIPVFNKVNYIGQCLYSLINQSYTNFEVVIIDDGSTDESKEVIDLIVGKDNRFKYYYQENKGVSIARNLGVSLSKGDYICFLDADDEYDPYYIEKMLSAISTGNADACSCAHLINIGKNKKKAKFIQPGSNFLYSYLANTCTPNTNSWLIRRSFVQENNLHFRENVSWGEDMLFFSDLILKSKKTVFLHEYLTIYNMGLSDSLSANDIDKIEKDLYWLNIVKDNIAKSRLEENYKIKCSRLIDEYRIPGSILYRIFYNRNMFSRSVLCDVLQKNDVYLERLSLINGLRSCKLFLLHLLIKIFLNRYL